MSKLLLGTQKFSLFWLFILQQTNTADMLDLAVEYIKDLQKQVKVLYKLLSVHQNHMKLFLFLLSVEKKSHMNLQLLLSSHTKSLFLVQTLTDTKAKCSCSSKQKQYSNHSA